MCAFLFSTNIRICVFTFKRNYGKIQLEDIIGKGARALQLSLRKYLSSFIKSFASFLVVILLCVSVVFIDGINTGVFLALVLPISSLILLFPAIYYLAMFFVFKKKCIGVTPMECTIATWEAGFFRYSGSIVVRIDEKEYSTSAYFSHAECRELVGKSALCAIIDDTLIVYEIKS